MGTTRATVTVEIPRDLVELLYLRAASGLHDLGGIPPADARRPAPVSRPIGEAGWTTLWTRQLEQRGAGTSPAGTVRDQVLAAGADLDDLRAWVQEVVQALTSDLMRNARHDAAMADEERDLVGGRTVAVIPVRGDLASFVGPRLLLVSHQLRTRPEAYLARLRELQA